MKYEVRTGDKVQIIEAASLELALRGRVRKGMKYEVRTGDKVQIIEAASFGFEDEVVVFYDDLREPCAAFLKFDCIVKLPDDEPAGWSIRERLDGD